MRAGGRGDAGCLSLVLLWLKTSLCCAPLAVVGTGHGTGPGLLCRWVVEMRLLHGCESREMWCAHPAALWGGEAPLREKEDGFGGFEMFNMGFLISGFFLSSPGSVDVLLLWTC